MANTTQKYFRENFDGTETANIQPSESFPVYGILLVLHLLDFKKLNDSCVHDYLELSYHCINQALKALSLLACIYNNRNMRVTCEWHLGVAMMANEE